MITSGCTGWAPNAARLLVSDSVMGSWEYIENPCVGEDKEPTFHAQSTYILPVAGKKKAFIFMSDRGIRIMQLTADTFGCLFSLMKKGTLISNGLMNGTFQFLIKSNINKYDNETSITKYYHTDESL